METVPRLVDPVLSSRNQKNEFFVLYVFFVKVSSSIPDMPKGSTANLISFPLSNQAVYMFVFFDSPHFL